VTDVVLASASPRRALLLRSAGLSPRVEPVDCDESARAGEVATAYARRIARAKLDAVSGEYDAPVLTADTVVWRPHPPTPIGKPRDRADAARLLGLLGDGSAHRVTTAFAIRWPDASVRTGEVTTTVWMRRLGATEIAAYLDTDEWVDKAGGYGIQGRAASLVARIDGSYTNVVGLPLAEVVDALARRTETA
jgi:septum formation protein